MQATSLPMESMGHKSKKEANFVKKYEVMFIVNAANDEVIKAAVKLVQDTITRIGGTVDKVDEWGKTSSCLRSQTPERRLLRRSRFPG